ncbi:unnamed protein product [Schistosoma mattheei]|uniref:Mitochondrial import receptor subunit TOM22 homolog n=1 Tax=Schistosoma mattheei TaxID=31246 RepID=A0A183NZQ8_9TREM|nr:unnamed protein product [Schistosoma mattheei]
MDIQDAFEDFMISSSSYPTEVIDLTNSDTDTKPISPAAVRHLSREKNKSTSKALAEADGCSKDMGEKNVCEDEDFDIEDESIIERLIGLLEMFPEPVRRGVSFAYSAASEGVVSGYSLSRSVTWFLVSTATVCFLPLILELERVQTEEQEAVQQRAMMLGPRAAGGGSGLAGFSAAVPHLTHIEPK